MAAGVRRERSWAARRAAYEFHAGQPEPRVHREPPSCPDTLEIITRGGKAQGGSLLRFSWMQSETRRVVVVAYLPREILRLRCYEVNPKLQGVAMVSPCSTTGDEVFLAVLAGSTAKLSGSASTTAPPSFSSRRMAGFAKLLRVAFAVSSGKFRGACSAHEVVRIRPIGLLYFKLPDICTRCLVWFINTWILTIRWISC